MRKSISFLPKVLLIFSLLYLTSHPAHAQQKAKGEIININYEYKIAFTDMGGDSLSVGDIVQVRLSSGQMASLQVIEATSILSKLAPRDGSQQGLFNEIEVGNVVLRTGRSSGAAETTRANTVRNNSQDTFVQPKAVVQPSPQVQNRLDLLSLDYQKLQLQHDEAVKEKEVLLQKIAQLNQQLGERVTRLEELEGENKALKKELSRDLIKREELDRKKQEQTDQIQKLNDVINQLDKKLQNMSKMIDRQL